MAYIGQSPLNKGIGLFSQDTFTGDGSTTTFDLTHAAPDAGGNEIQVFVDNVRQQEGSSNAYTLGLDGSSENKRITFTTAPAASQSIFVLNPGTKNVQQISIVGDNTVTASKIVADSVNASKIADDSISEEHLDVTSVTGHTELSAAADADDVLLVFDTSASALKKIQRSNLVLQTPTFTSISPSNATTGDGTGNHTFTITGTKFDAAPTVTFINASGTSIAASSTTRNSATQLTVVIAKSSLPNSGEPYDVKVTNSSGLAIQTTNDPLNIDAQPVFTTSAGSLGTVNGGATVSLTVNATDPESAGNVTFELQSGSLPAGLSLSNEGTEGGTARISGTATNPSANTTSNFVLRAVDAASNTTSRAFAITVNRVLTSTSFTSSGTFAVPSGVSVVDVLVVAGGAGGGHTHGPGPNHYTGSGGGGAGGLIFMPSAPVTPGGTVAITVGDGGAANGPGGLYSGQDSVFGASPSPGTSNTLTAKGGGNGGVSGGQAAAPVKPAGDGGSGGGGNRDGGPGGSATQPTQSGNSGAYGFGNPGGDPTGTETAGGGGGGAGAAGATSTAGQPANGGIGKAYSIADGTTSVYYSGGGGGGGSGNPSHPGPGTSGGQGGGGNGSGRETSNAAKGQNGTANRGGGGGGNGGVINNGGAQTPSSTGGKGVVIVRF